MPRFEKFRKAVIAVLPGFSEMTFFLSCLKYIS